MYILIPILTIFFGLTLVISFTQKSKNLYEFGNYEKTVSKKTLELMQGGFEHFYQKKSSIVSPLLTVHHLKKR